MDNTLPVCDEAFEVIVAHVLDGLFALGPAAPRVTHPEGDPFVIYKAVWSAADTPSYDPNHFRCLTLTDAFTERIEDGTYVRRRIPSLSSWVVCQGRARSNNEAVHGLQRAAIRSLVALSGVSKRTRARLTPFWRPVYQRFAVLYRQAFRSSSRWIDTYIPLASDRDGERVLYLPCKRHPEWYRLAVIGLCAQLHDKARKAINIWDATSLVDDPNYYYISKATRWLCPGDSVARCGYDEEEIWKHFYHLADKDEWLRKGDHQVEATVRQHEAIMADVRAMEADMQALVDAEMAQTCDGA